MGKHGVGAGLVAALLVLAGCGQPVESDERSAGHEPKSSPETAGSWTELPRAPSGHYRPEGAFWIDDRLVVVAGSVIESWDPDTNKWRTLARIPQADECEGCGYSETAVWTGRELLLWGGGFSYRSPDGGAHEGISVALNGSIAPLPVAPIPVRWWHGAIWTGSEMIVFGGGDDAHGRRDGAAYDPSARTWRTIAEAPVGGYANTLLWTGKEMITWGGIKDSKTNTGFPAAFVATGAAYNPEADSWRMLEGSELEPRGWHSAVWTGDEMIIWGGVGHSESRFNDSGYPEDAGGYDPASGTWRQIDDGPLSGRVEHTAVWTGSRMIVYGGSSPGGGSGRFDGAAYDPESDSWAKLPEAPIEGRYRHAATWTGEAMIVWGGQTPRGSGFSDGASFRPHP